MKKYDPKKPLVSIHIPKCGGTSIVQVLNGWFGKGLLLHYHDEKTDQRPFRYNLYQDPWKKKFIGNLCIHGHFNRDRGNGVEKYYPELDQFITFIRDPFELHVSAYFFRKRRAREEGGKVYWSGKQHPIIANNWSLEDYLREWNESYLLSFLPSNITLDNYEQVLKDKFLYIGLAEEMQKSIVNLARILGYPNVPVPVANKSSREEDIPAGAREEFITNNPLVMAIYEYAVKHYDAYS